MAEISAEIADAFSELAELQVQLEKRFNRELRLFIGDYRQGIFSDDRMTKIHFARLPQTIQKAFPLLPVTHEERIGNYVVNTLNFLKMQE